MNFKRVLIANRGEIALRIIRTLKLLEIESVVIYSEVDKDLPYVKYADYSENIGEPLNYLNMELILDIAKKYNVNAIHPGYGFLSENAEFSKIIEENGIKFIGPNYNAIKLLGDKSNAKSIAREIGIPIAQSSTALTNIEEIKNYIKNIGLPVLLKASAGGGGKGMKKIESLENIDEIILSAKREALSSFKDDRIIVEKFIYPARHIEVQVIADNYGNVFIFGERECSLQRRHQKIIEEALSPALNEDERNELYEYARKIVKYANYTNAGTVEFLYSDGKFYFLEVNSRIQVEHPVSEMITKYDLIRLQIEVAQGKELKNEKIEFRGHSIEARLYAEDPLSNFFPQTGKIEYIEYPIIPFVRIDYGYETNNEITPFYDPMIAKFISYGETREIARKRLIHTLKSVKYLGPINNLEFLIFLLESEEFKTAQTYTHTIDEILDKYKKIDRKLPIEVLEFVSNSFLTNSRKIYSQKKFDILSSINAKIYP
ncbi:MAG: ATP-grasp domain-containing protein [candidate division WOR-3 bacterium]|nr:ATP-grasp domain-containing protein [candidate division WOR-3 bacterium]MCX7948227.1 ATP-grasp domain-containing protein [candidate division WOR-3 bacterium]MDW8150029.1 biotin carboxylase N-terminal domain-containing protein [candidate division WOR-3 bacterium]